MFSELTSIFFRLGEELMRRLENLKLKYFLEKMTLCDMLDHGINLSKK